MFIHSSLEGPGIYECVNGYSKLQEAIPSGTRVLARPHFSYYIYIQVSL